MAMKTAEEHEVGISCFISDLRGFRGILKQRSPHFLHNSLLPSSLHIPCLMMHAEVHYSGILTLS